MKNPGSGGTPAKFKKIKLRLAFKNKLLESAVGNLVKTLVLDEIRTVMLSAVVIKYIASSSLNVFNNKKLLLNIPNIRY